MDFPLLLKEYFIGAKLIHLFEPDRAIVINNYQNGHIAFPYWSQVWPAAIGLSRFIINHPHYTQGKHVLELAAGLGLPSIVAAANAASVVASDYEEEALSAIQKSTEFNHLQNLQVQLLNWYALPANLFADILLLSDVSYDAALFSVQEKVIHNFLQQGTVVIMSTPQRLIAKKALMPLHSFCIHQEEIVVLHNGAEVIITIMVMQQNETLLH